MDRKRAFKWVIIVLGTLTLAGGGGVWFVLKHTGKSSKAQDSHQAQATQDASHSKASDTDHAENSHKTEHSSQDLKTQDPQVQNHQKDDQAKQASPSIFGKVVLAWQSVQNKIERLKRSEEENARLKIENVHLQTQLESVQFDCRLENSKKISHELSQENQTEVRSRVGRTLAGINYRVPNHLLPSQLHTLGVNYLRSGEDEKSAVLFTFLSELESSQEYKTPKHLLLTAVAWYRIHNYREADRYLDQVLAFEDQTDILVHKAQARLWKALISERTHDRKKAQAWLKDLVDHHPHSTEAAWVNGKFEKENSHGQNENTQTHH